MDFKKIIDEYTEDYCKFLEATYSEGMMSEGGAVAIERMFKGIDLNQKTILDIGFGLGGVPLYLAENHHTHVIGIELNPWLAEEATRRIPTHLTEKVKYFVYETPSQLPFPDSHFDVIYSKGVLVHLKDKSTLFAEIFRALKPGGILVIDDWLSPTKDKWGERVQQMCDLEDLTLYPETEQGYQKVLQQAGLLDCEMRDENIFYAKYNQRIVDQLNEPEYAELFIKKFGEQSWQEAVIAYQAITDAMRDGELLVRWIKCVK